MIREEQVQALKNLGLSLVQAKTYLNLAKLGTADIKTIAAASNVARQDTYRVMSALEKLGLAEKIIAKTTMYEATPIKDGFSALLRNKREEYVGTKKQVERILSSCEKADQSVWHENVQFTITSKWDLLLKMHNKLADSTKKSIDMALPIRISLETLLQDMRYIKRATRRGVKIRAIAQEVDRETIDENLEPLLKKSLFELRHLPDTSILFGMHIFDEREMTLAVTEEKPLPSLWTNSPHVVKLAKVYFESMWNHAEIKHFSSS
jgi:sugar-specific transcriptional regulator TrmB